VKQFPLIISTDPLTHLSTAPAREESTDAGETTDASDLSDASELRTFTIGVDEHGQRLDRALATLVPEFSRSYLQQMIDGGMVSLQGRAITKTSTTVRAGQVGQIELRPTLQSQAFRPEAMAIDVVFEDDHLRVINKPAGLVVHPAPGNWSGTLLNGLLALDPKAALLPRAGIVHRLDKDTSGLLMVARTRATMDALVDLIAAREVKRQYLAMGHKPWEGGAARQVDAPIGRDPRNRLRMAVVDLDRHPGKAARTLVERLDGNAHGCSVRCTLETGRTHQIRVHMALLGHPLVGDALYGGAAAAGLTRQALHAFRLAFVHPMTKELMSFNAPVPADLAAGLQAWGLDYNRL
jgi:23S rRNA pseudouridine1911/1915/1917 synthase